MAMTAVPGKIRVLTQVVHHNSNDNSRSRTVEIKSSNIIIINTKHVFLSVKTAFLS